MPQIRPERLHLEVVRGVEVDEVREDLEALGGIHAHPLRQGAIVLLQHASAFIGAEG